MPRKKKKTVKINLQKYVDQIYTKQHNFIDGIKTIIEKIENDLYEKVEKVVEDLQYEIDDRDNRIKELEGELENAKMSLEEMGYMDDLSYEVEELERENEELKNEINQLKAEKHDHLMKKIKEIKGELDEQHKSGKINIKEKV